MTDPTINLPRLSQILGVNENAARMFLYSIIPQKGWPGKGGRWAFTRDQLGLISALYWELSMNNRRPPTDAEVEVLMNPAPGRMR